MYDTRDREMARSILLDQGDDLDCVVCGKEPEYTVLEHDSGGVVVVKGCEPCKGMEYCVVAPNRAARRQMWSVVREMMKAVESA